MIHFDLQTHSKPTCEEDRWMCIGWPGFTVNCEQPEAPLNAPMKRISHMCECELETDLRCGCTFIRGLSHC